MLRSNVSRRKQPSLFSFSTYSVNTRANSLKEGLEIPDETPRSSAKDLDIVPNASEKDRIVLSLAQPQSQIKVRVTGILPSSSDYSIQNLSTRTFDKVVPADGASRKLIFCANIKFGPSSRIVVERRLKLVTCIAE